MPNAALADHCLQVVWPIVDVTLTHSELVAEAAPQLEDLAEEAGAFLTGPPQWRILDAAEVIGWEAYAPGSVLVGTAPAERVPEVWQFTDLDLRRRDELDPDKVHWARTQFILGHGVRAIQRTTGLPERFLRDLGAEMRAAGRLEAVPA